MKRRITVLGTGRMGSALALAFLARENEVTVWNRTPGKASALAARGARVAPSVQAAVAEAEMIVGNVSDYPTTAALLSPPVVTAALRNKLFVQLATGTPREAREMAAWAGEHGIDYLDGAIMATPNFIGQAGCTIVYSGAKERFEAYAPTLSALGGNALHVGVEAGHAAALDAAVLIVLWGSLYGTWQAAAICEAEGFPLETLASSLGATMPVFKEALEDSVGRIGRRRFTADDATMATVETCHASVRLIHQINREHGLHLGLTSALAQVFERASNAGRDKHDLAAVYQTLSAPSGASGN